MSATGEQLAMAGMAQADAAASEEWKQRWDHAIALLAWKGEPFTADDVREIAGAPEDHPNAAGARFNRAARAGLIRRVGSRKSSRAVLHSHWISEWAGTAKAREVST